jgi:hypothetical protein
MPSGKEKLARSFPAPVFGLFSTVHPETSHADQSGSLKKVQVLMQRRKAAKIKKVFDHLEHDAVIP